MTAVSRATRVAAGPPGEEERGREGVVPGPARPRQSKARPGTRAATRPGRPKPADVRCHGQPAQGSPRTRRHHEAIAALDRAEVLGPGAHRIVCAQGPQAPGAALLVPLGPGGLLEPVAVASRKAVERENLVPRRFGLTFAWQEAQSMPDFPIRGARPAPLAFSMMSRDFSSRPIGSEYGSRSRERGRATEIRSRRERDLKRERDGLSAR